MSRFNSCKTNLVVIADEIYSELVYSGHHTSIAEFIPGQTLVLNGASKSQAMTGYRVGFIAGPQELMKPVSAIHAMMVTAAADPMMAAAAKGFTSEEGKQATLKMKADYKQRRDTLVPALRELGFEITNPNGSFLCLC